MLIRSAAVSAIAPIEEIFEEAINGRPYILVDAEDRENEGDVIVPAQFSTPQYINFMAKHARGLICLALTEERAKELHLPPMAPAGRTAHGTAFTVSIEAREGVTTGISAYDRARTIAVATDPTKGAKDIVSPGHVFPLVAREGGVLVRAGHTEAAVDVSRIAGLQPSGVICEIMDDEGAMARLPQLIAFAQKHGLKIGTIADLIAYRRRSERCVTNVHSEPYDTIYCAGMTLSIFRNVFDGAEHVALTKGVPTLERPTLVRVHQMDFANDMLSPPTPRRDIVREALRIVGEHDGPAVMVFIRDPSRFAISERRSAGGGITEEQAVRDYGVGAQILLDLGVRDMIILSSNHARMPSIEGYGLRIVGQRPLCSGGKP